MKHRLRIVIALASITTFFYLVYPSNKQYQRPPVPKIYYNLMEERSLNSPPMAECTLDFANSHRLQQDHPCVLDLIRRQYLNNPSPPEVPLKLDHPENKDPSAGQVTAVLRLLNNMTNGFYIESGAADGEAFSNSIFLERYMNWSGLLIEAEPGSYAKLAKRNRKSWTVPTCLSLEKYPTEVSFDRDDIIGKIRGGKLTPSELEKGAMANVQCFPLYSILLAHGRKTVDFFSLDVEGHELQILKTIPWHKVDITIITVEWEHVKEGYYAIVDYMKENGYVNFGNIATPYARDVVFVKDFLQDLRSDYDN